MDMIRHYHSGFQVDAFLIAFEDRCQHQMSSLSWKLGG
jgi:hypothetical protein